MSEQVILSLSYLRRSAGLTQKQLAERIGVTRQSVMSWEAGGHSPASKHIRTLALIFGVSVQIVLDALEGVAA